MNARVASLGSSLSRAWAWVRLRIRSLGSVGVVGIGIVGLLVAVFLAEGFRASTFDLQDPVVWVTKAQDGSNGLVFGRLNVRVGQLDSVNPAADAGDVVQDGGAVWLTADAAGPQQVDPATQEVGKAVSLGDGASLAGLAGGRYLVVKGGSGWTGPAEELGRFTEGRRPDVKADAKGLIALGRDGSVAGLSVKDGSVTVVSPSGEHRQVGMSLDGVTSPDGLELTLVGSTPVVSDPAARRVFIPGASPVVVGADGERPMVQAPGGDSDRVVVASGPHMWAVPLSGGAPKELFSGGQGASVRPVVAGGCAYGAWSNVEAVRCAGGSGGDLALTGVSGPDALRFRVNRSNVALNVMSTGAVVVFDGKELRRLDLNWDKNDGSADTTSTTTPDKPPTEEACAKDQAPPTANDDETGARRGRLTMVSVLANDSDANCDVLVVESVKVADPSQFSVSIVNQGQAVAVMPLPGAPAEGSFEYTITDGRGGTASATVRVHVKDDGENSAPRPRPGVKQRPFQVELQGAPGSYDVMSDWEDPDGDPIVVAGVDAGDPAVGQAESVPSGRITYTATGGVPGKRNLTVKVADVPPAGIQSKSTDKPPLEVTVSAKGVQGEQAKPLPVPDHVVLRAGTTVVVDPLRNDVDPKGLPLRVTRLLDLDGVPIPAGVTRSQPSPVDGTVTISAAADTAPGSFQFGYEVTNGYSVADSRIRVDVVGSENRPPGAAPDVVVLNGVGYEHAGTVDVLANDWDPDGDVIMVSKVSPPAGSPVHVQLLEHRRVRVWSDAPLSKPVVVPYTVSDGALSAEGQIFVMQAASDAVNHPPVVGDDSASVRVGDVVSIPVLANDVDPEGDDLILNPKLIAEPQAGQGRAWVSGSVVRFVAPSTPGTVRFSYGVSDGHHPDSSGQVTVTVLAASASNSPPVPKPVEARVLAGTSVRVVIPLAGLDPDGDSVRLVGIAPASAPKYGRVVTPVGTDSISYEAFSTSPGGPDSFGYVVQDSRGATATGVVRVVVAARTGNSPPVAGVDRVKVRPGGSVVVSVLDNDYDPDGDAISLAPFQKGDVPDGLTATIEGSRVRLSVPDHAIPPVTYRVTDDPSSPAAAVPGTIEVTVAPDAANVPPIARDDQAEVSGTDVTSVKVDVLANDEDPDGPVDARTGRPTDLKVDLPDAPSWAKVVKDDGVDKVVVTPGAERRVVTYRDTDPDGGTGYAVVRVPSTAELANRPPVIKKNPEPVKAKHAVEVGIKVSDYVTDPEGKPVQVVNNDSVSATKGKAEARTGDVVSYTPDDDARGAASLTFTVTDLTDVNDQSHWVTVSVPAVIEGKPAPPTMLAGRTLEVAVGEDAHVKQDLKAWLDPDTAPDSAIVGFEMESAGGQAALPKGLHAELSGSTLETWADADAAVGTSGPVSFTLTNTKESGLKTPGQQVVVSVVASKRPLPACTPVDIPDANAGAPSSVEVLASCSNPFPDKELSISGISADNAATAKVDGSKVTVTPAQKFVGTVTATYTVTDKVGRTGTGVVRVTVRDVPGAPGAPTIVTVASRQVTLSWQPPDPHGADIDYYQVEANGISPFRCDSTTCTVTGLTNDVEYQFAIRAHNTVGDGPLGPTAPARPDQRPDPPAGVSLTFDKTQLDGKLVAKWGEARSEGSKVTGYEVQVSPPPVGAAGILQVGNVTTKVLDGLTNGTSYTIKVRALNKSADGPGDFSVDSNPEIPANVPDPPGKPTVTRVNDPLGKKVQVTWTTPKNNGDAISGYRIDILKQGATTVDSTVKVDGQTVNQIVDVTNTDNKFQMRITATNKAGDSKASDLSVPVQAQRAPDPVTGVQPTPSASDGVTGLDQKVQLVFAQPYGGGVPIDHYVVNISGRAPQQFRPGGGQGAQERLTVTGLVNGTDFTFTVVACNDVYCTDRNPSPPVSANPYGPVGQPSVRVVGTSQTTITFQVDAPAPNGRAVHLEGANPGQTTMVIGCQQSYSLTAVAVDEAGQRSAPASASGSTNTCPPPPTYDRTITDSFLGGTWTQTGTQGGIWYSQGSRPSWGVDWHANGWSAPIICAQSGSAYTVKFAAKADETWYWFMKLSDGRFIRAAVAFDADGGNGIPRC